MWAQYSTGGKAISVQSAYATLRECLGDSVYGIGLIKYIDYEAEQIPSHRPLFSRFMRKRRSVEHEKELRALIYNTGEIPDYGVWRPIDLNALIDRIHVAPTSPKWYVSVVQGVAARYGLNTPVFRSSLDSDPIF